MSAINHKSTDLYRKVKYMIIKWQSDNRGQVPRYLFLSPKAYTLLSVSEDMYMWHNEVIKFMGIEIALVDVPVIYAAIGEDFN